MVEMSLLALKAAAAAEVELSLVLMAVLVEGSTLASVAVEDPLLILMGVVLLRGPRQEGPAVDCEVECENLDVVVGVQVKVVELVAVHV